jgi:hypothetical protein
MRLTAPGPPAVPALLPPEAKRLPAGPEDHHHPSYSPGARPASTRTTAIGPAAARVPPNLPIAADGRLDGMDKDPDEATLISPGYGRDFSGEKEHLMPGGLVTQGNGISSGTLMAMR